MENRIQPQWAMWSEQVYRALLALYPADFRRDYANLMMQTFRDISRDTYRREGLAGIALWWGAALLDIGISAVEQRRKEPFSMSKSMLPQWAGRLLIAGGACLAPASISQLQPGSHDAFTGMYQIAFMFFGPAYLLIGLGCLGLPARYHAKTEPLTRITLYLSGIGALATALGVSLSSLPGAEILWAVGMAGLILHIIAMWVFGFANITRPILPMSNRLRWLPVLTALLPFVMLYGSQEQPSRGGADWLQFAYLIGVGVAWLIIGAAIRRDRQAEAETAAA